MSEIINQPIERNMKESYLDYAMSVIIGRALPDVRDGLKPVHRRIIYAMSELGNTHDKPYKKSARVVGECLGKFHPHGDIAIYDSLVRMAQDFNMRYTLVDGQGNFGCFTKDNKVRLVDGRNLSFEELVKEDKKRKQNYTFTIDENRKIKIGMIGKPRLTIKNAEIMKIVLDNGEEIKCTLNHRFMLRNGEYKEARNLQAGDSLMSIYTRFSTKEEDPDLEGYEMILQPKEDRWEYIHYLADEWNLKQGVYVRSRSRIRHHIDFNKLNKNHKIVRTELLEEREDVYDLTIDKTHNFALAAGVFVHNSIDGDSAAAMRYSEVRMKKLAEDMLVDIDKETVSFTPNFDGTLKEPTVLPSKIPTLLINGSTGIAVGMATNIPPHNLGEIVDALVAIINGAEENEIFKLVLGPDFPTGGTIIGRNGIYQAYKTGKGIIRLRAKIESDEKKKQLIIKEIPYQLTKTAIIEAIADGVKDKKIEGISGIRDISDKDRMEVVIELKKDAMSEVVLNQLYTNTPLESSFGIINLSLVNNSPKTLPLFNMLKLFVEFRQEIVRKRCVFEKKQAEARAHILEGLMIALRKIDKVITFIKSCSDPKTAKLGLINEYLLSEKQAEAILEMKLQRLTGLERERIESELVELKKLIIELANVLADEKKILNIIKEELLDIRKKYADARRTQINESDDERTIEDLIPNEEVVVFISHKGYVKRVPLLEYRTQKRGGKGVVGTETKEEDFVEDVIVTKTHNYILFFTDKGRVHWLKTYNIQEGSRYASGKPIVNMLELKDEKITAWISMDAFSDKEFLVMITKNGIVKRIGADAFANPRRGGIIAITLKENDSLIEVKKTNGNNEIFIATTEGYAIRFNENDARELGRTGQGVIGIRLRGKDAVIGATVCDKPAVLTITENGYGKRTEFSEYKVQARGGMGIINIDCTEKTGKVVGVKSVDNNDEIIVISSKGQTIRSPVMGIRIIGRNTQGVRIIRLTEGENAASLAVVQNEESKKI